MYVYIMKCANYYKIGISNDPKKRRETIQTHNPLDVFLCATLKTENPRKIEKKLHSVFIEKNTRGEWFELQESDLSMLLIQYNFDFLENIFKIDNEKYDNTIEESQTKKFRLKNKDLAEAIYHFENIYDCQILNKQNIKKSCLKYGLEIVLTCINKAFEIGYSSQKAYDKLFSFCKYEYEKINNPEKYLLSVVKSVFWKHYNESITPHDEEILLNKLYGVKNVEEIVEFIHKEKYKVNDYDLYFLIINMIKYE